MIKTESLCKSFGDVRVLKSISIQVNKGDVVALIGPSGSGKSTLLRCVAGLEKPDSGKLLIEEKTPDRRTALKTGMVFQSFNLFPQMTVIDNITLAPLLVKKTGKEDAEKLAISLLRKVGLEKMARKYPLQLSGGEKQRVAIARALAMKPDIMLFDEPTSALDPELTGEVLKAIKKLADDRMTILLASHEMAFVRQVADRVVFMEKGSVVAQGEPESLFARNANPRVFSFLNRITSFAS